MRHRSGLTLFLVGCVLAAVNLSGCQEEAATGPQIDSVRLARPGTDTVTVTGADPASAPQDTTLDVEVSGSGFDQSSTVQLTLDGNPTDKVRTNSTLYRNPRKLIANITIAADAPVDLYDVEVMASRKKGIGTEMFEVKVKVQGNASSVSVELLGPGTGEEDTSDPYNLRSGGPRQAWRTDDNALNLEMHDFPVTLAFSQADAVAMTDPTAPVEGECPVVHEWLFGSETRLGLQERNEPLRGLFSFYYDGRAAILSLKVHDPFDEGGKNTYLLRFSGSVGTAHLGDLTVVAETDGTTFVVEGSTVSIGKWRYGKDPYKLTKAEETPWCKLPLADFTLRLRE